MNMISSPGSGKTTILARTINELKNKSRIGVIEGDIQTDIDAQRIKPDRRSGDTNQYRRRVSFVRGTGEQRNKNATVDELDLIIIENVGNLVCPSAFELGESGKIVVLLRRGR